MEGKTKHYKSDEARLKLRDILDDAIAGKPSTVKRYGKPIAVVISHEAWIAIQKAISANPSTLDGSADCASILLSMVQRALEILHPAARIDARG